MTQLTFTPFKNFQAALTYANAYHQINVLGTSLTNADIITALDSPLSSPIRIHGVGGLSNGNFSPNFPWRVTVPTSCPKPSRMGIMPICCPG